MLSLNFSNEASGSTLRTSYSVFLFPMICSYNQVLIDKTTILISKACPSFRQLDRKRRFTAFRACDKAPLGGMKPCHRRPVRYGYQSALHLLYLR